LQFFNHSTIDISKLVFKRLLKNEPSFPDLINVSMLEQRETTDGRSWIELEHLIYESGCGGLM